VIRKRNAADRNKMAKPNVSQQVVGIFFRQLSSCTFDSAFRVH
jgi:hypothetical protein